MGRFNLFLFRGLSLASKFILLFVLAGKGGDELVITYGIFFSMITYVTYFLSFDLYTYTTRVYVKSSVEKKFSVLYQHVISTLLISIITLPIMYFLFYFNVLNVEYILYFYFIVILEFICAEIYRLLVACKLANKAVFYLFLRGGCWPIIYSVVGYANPKYLNVYSLFTFWIVGLLIAFFIGIFFIRQYVNMPRKAMVFRKNVFIKSLHVAIPILLSTLSIRGIFTLDRIFISNATDLSYVSSYVFFTSVSGAIIAFVDSGILVKYMPLLLDSSQQRYIENKKSMIFQTVIISVVLACLIFVSLFFLMSFESYIKYSGHMNLLLLSLLSSVFYTISQSYSVLLYVNDNDLYQIVCNASIFILGSFAGFFLSPLYIPYIICAQCLLLLFIKRKLTIYLSSRRTEA